MTRSYRFRVGRIFVFISITFQLFIVSECRHYDKCLTRDGRQGVCVAKRYCREANKHTLVPCDNDGENHCCPIHPSQRSAAPPQQSGPDYADTNRPDYVEKNRSDYVEKNRPRPAVEEEIRGDDRLNMAPSSGDRRHPTRHGGSPPNKRPPARENDYGSGGPRPLYQQDRDRENSPPKDRDRGYGNARPATRPNNDRRNNPSRRPDDDDDDRAYPTRHHPETTRDPGSRRRDTKEDRAYPTRHQSETARNPGSRRTNSPMNKTEDTARAPIRFPDSYELPSPKVPACGVKPYDLFIAGGEQSEEHEWPWMTAIFRRYPDSRPKMFLCGGSLINTKYVLTAAHCFVNNYVILPASSFVVRLGSHYLNSGEEYTVANLVLHHNHSGSDFFNDIALVRLASEVYVTDKIAPICLPDPAMMHDDLVGRMATVAGWGDTSFRTSQTRLLQHVTIPIVSGDECFAAYSRVRGAAFLARGSDHVICAGLREGGKDACLGDSGGPLMLKMPDDRWVIVGIVSLGYKCAEPGYPGVYTRVTHYMSWIDTNMKRY